MSLLLVTLSEVIFGIAHAFYDTDMPIISRIINTVDTVSLILRVLSDLCHTSIMHKTLVKTVSVNRDIRKYIIFYN